MTNREPPNFRQADSCATCDYRRWDMTDQVNRCQKHDGAIVADKLICDDYEPEVKDERP